jgi:hypothetical protein
MQILRVMVAFGGPFNKQNNVLPSPIAMADTSPARSTPANHREEGQQPENRLQVPAIRSGFLLPGCSAEKFIA